MSPRLLRATLGVVTGLLATLLYVGSRGPAPAVPLDDDPFLATPLPAPDLDLVDPDGRPLGIHDFEGRAIAVFFGYTHCPDVCPITLAQLSRLASELDPDQERLALLFVSLDPMRDTPEDLRAFTARLPGVVAGTAPVEVLRPQALEWGIGFLYRPLGGGAADSLAPPVGPDGGPLSEYLVDHTARTFLVDAQGRIVAQLLPQSDTRLLREALERVLARP